MTREIFIKRRAEVAARLLGAKYPGGFKFKMSTFLDGDPLEENFCNTRGCIAGLVVVMYADRPEEFFWNREKGCVVDREARILLGLSQNEARELFLPPYIFSVSELQAGRVLSRFVLTDRINWEQRDEPIQIGKREF